MDVNLFTIDIDADVSAKVSSSRTPLCAIITYGEHRLVFPLSAIITKKDTVDIDPIEQFYVLNDYIARKGEDFKRAVFETYFSVCGTLEKFSDSLANDPVELYAEIYKIFDLFNIDDLIEHIRILASEGKVKVPENLSKEIDEFMVKDEIGSEEQTYLREDYVDLVGLVTFVKATYPILIQYDSIFLDEKNGPKKDAILFDIYRQYNPFIESRPMLKLGQFTEQIVLGPKRKKEEIEQQMLEKSLSKEDFKPYFLAQIVLERLSIAPILRDNDDRHLILSNYGFLMNRVNSSGSPKHKVKALVPMVSSDGEHESICESMKQVTEIPLATQSTINISCSTMDMLLRQFSRYPKYVELLRGIEVDGKLYTCHDVRNMLEDMKGLVIPFTTVSLVKTFCKKIFDPRFISVLRIDSMLNLMSACFVYMYNIGYKHLALTITTVDTDFTDNHSVYTNNDFKKLEPEVIEALRAEFPLYTPPSKQVKEKTYIIEDKVKEVARRFLDSTRITVLPREVLLDLFQEGKDFAINGELNVLQIQSDIRKNISLYLVENEKIRRD